MDVCLFGCLIFFDCFVLFCFSFLSLFFFSSVQMLILPVAEIAGPFSELDVQCFVHFLIDFPIKRYIFYLFITMALRQLNCRHMKHFTGV